ncbi:hypothetical protein CC1G_04670 [Coprinopsis cinerea okayama7|uniref:F-box domain-containing protein n=1 Tax=Coprinopsis cinerea (strain Okayama-7 / 130 / ATCC MYA-4618 / FGSC 9003) TaxID=240176 RepID=A8N563_COPC7|nr:hypothetical protein CC1G_04670 [Coprinopsis cinerea okayama7\|eukprot:XP_001829981.2 hypothetical protein CC1G_04670 [Coprinopsis cinerea okayama7\
MGFPFDLLRDERPSTPTRWPTREGLQFYYPFVARPYMLKHQVSEMDAIQMFIRHDYERKKEEEIAKDTIEMTKIVLLYRRIRFLDIYEGFIEGCLDLTGRHESRWTEYMEGFEEYIRDFDKLVPFIITVTRMEEYPWGDKYPVTEYELRARGDGLYSRWMQRWDIKQDEAYGCLHRSLLTHKLWKTKPKPKFQTLTLIDLPEDVLELVFDECSRPQLLAISKTCRALRWARGHCLMDSSITFSELKEQTIAQTLDPDSNPLPQLAPYLQTAYKRCMDRIAYHLENPKQCMRMQTLSVSFSWRWFPWRWDPGSDPLRPIDEVLHATMFKSLLGALRPLLKPEILCNLTHLHFGYTRFDVEGLSAICSLRKLRTMSFQDCSLERSGDMEALLQGETPPFVSPAINLELRFGYSDPPNTQWPILTLFPCVRNLSLVSFDGYNGLHFPDEVLHSKFRCINVLERLFVNCISDATIPHLASWLAERPSRHSDDVVDTLAYFKISNDYHLSEDAMRLLLTSLRSERLKVLALDGIKYQMGYPNFIEFLTQLFPNLYSLSLAVRANALQKSWRPVVWPEPSWAYAPRFAGFNCLEHFIWNYNTPVYDATPYPLERFERAVMGEVDQDQEEDWEHWSKVRDLLYFDDYERSAAPFAVHCPTLRTFSSDRLSPVCEITRDVDEGGVLRKVRIECLDGRMLFTAKGKRKSEKLREENPNYACMSDRWKDL